MISINPMIQQQRMMIRYDWEIDLNVYDERHYNKNTLKDNILSLESKAIESCTRRIPTCIYFNHRPI